MISGGLNLQQLAAGVPRQRLTSCCGSQSAEAQPLDFQWPGETPWPISCAGKNFHMEMDSSETTEVLLGERVHWERQTGGLRESYTLMVVCITFRGIYFDFPLASHLALPSSEYTFSVSQGPSLCAHTSLSQAGFYQRDL